MIDENTLAGSIIMAAIIGGSAVATRKCLEKSWEGMAKDKPPHKKPEEANTRDAILWAVLLGSTAGLVRLGIRKALKSKPTAQVN